MTEVEHDPDWLEEGEKYAIVGVGLRLRPGFRCLDLPGGVTARANAAFALPDYWREWLGSIRVDNLSTCTLYLIARMPSAAPEVINDEDKILCKRVTNCFHGLTMVRKYSAYEDPFVAGGGRVDGKIDVRSFRDLECPLGAIVENRSPLDDDTLLYAARVGCVLSTMDGPWPGHHWKIYRCIGIYHAARETRDILDRIHQFTRCIEGLIAATKGETLRRFKSRTELFVGSSSHDLMGELYSLRSDIEHLHEYRHLASRDRSTRIRLAELEAVSEWVARSCLVRILLDPQLMQHFGSASALDTFWNKPRDERRALWGHAVDPCAPLEDFDFTRVSNEVLGASR